MPDSSPLIEPFMFDLAALEAAACIVHRTVQPTPQIAWPLLALRSGAQVWVKHENHLPIGAFKMRGGLVLIDALMRGRLGAIPKGIVTATRGNHGLSQTFAGRRAGLKVAIVVPLNNSREKNAAIRAHGAELIETGRDYDEARVAAEGIAEERGFFLVPPFHPELMRGVATWALEFLRAVSDVDTVYAPIGMGSGICGLIRTRDLLGLRTRIVGVASTEAPAVALSFDSGRVVTTETAETMADGMAVRVPMPEVIEILRRGADRIIRVDDWEVTDAIRAYHEDTHNIAEGAGAAALAGLLQERDRMQGCRVGLVLTGGNIDRPLHARVLAGANG